MKYAKRMWDMIKKSDLSTMFLSFADWSARLQKYLFLRDGLGGFSLDQNSDQNSDQHLSNYSIAYSLALRS